MIPELTLLRGGDVLQLLDGREAEILEAVRAAYQAHADGKDVLPHSSFLHLPHASGRIIALPAFLGAEFQLAGVKWIASVPGNLTRGLDRASAVIILNDATTGHPRAVLEGSVISAKRTGAFAALAAATLLASGTDAVGFVGCGVINFEVARFIRVVFPDLSTCAAYDLDPTRARAFAARCASELGFADVTLAGSAEELFDRHRVVSIATTAAAPHLTGASLLRPEHVVLHVSLRDLDPRLLAGCVNVVDDLDHVMRENTALHQASLDAGFRNVRVEPLAEWLFPRDKPPATAGPIVFSPFGLGILDLAVAGLALGRAQESGMGMRVADFAPPQWSTRVADS